MRKSEAGKYDAYCGIDVGKESHFCRVLAADGETELLSRRVAQDEGELRGLFSEISRVGRPLVVVDQHAGFGALVVACAGEAGIDVASVPPGRFAGVAALHGEGKTDRSDAMVLATLPAESPRCIDLVPAKDARREDARALMRHRDALVRERTRAYNRAHDALGRACPPVERLLAGSGLHSAAALAALARYGAIGIARARGCDVRRWARAQKGFGAVAVEEVMRIRDAARTQRAALPAAGVLDLVVAGECARIADLERLDGELKCMIAGLCRGMPEIEILETMPGVGVVYALTIALEIGDVSRFPSAAALASYCGVGKCPRESGASVGRKRRKSYNRKLNRAVVESARCALRRPGPDLDYYEKKRSGDKGSRQALHALARKRVSIIYAMLKNMEPYRAA